MELPIDMIQKVAFAVGIEKSHLISQKRAISKLSKLQNIHPVVDIVCAHYDVNLRNSLKALLTTKKSEKTKYNFRDFVAKYYVEPVDITTFYTICIDRVVLTNIAIGLPNGGITTNNIYKIDSRYYYSTQTNSGIFYSYEQKVKRYYSEATVMKLVHHLLVAAGKLNGRSVLSETSNDLAKTTIEIVKRYETITPRVIATTLIPLIMKYIIFLVPFISNIGFDLEDTSTDDGLSPSSAGIDSDTTCPICLDPGADYSFSSGCSHKMHFNCYRQLMQNSPSAHCPICRMRSGPAA